MRRAPRTTDRVVPPDYIRWPEAWADYKLPSHIAAKIRRKYKVPFMRDGTARIWIDPVAWDDAVATYFQEIANG